MTTELVKRNVGVAARRAKGFTLPAIIAAADERAGRRFIEFFTAKIRNPNTRTAYARAVYECFRWCDERNVGLNEVEPVIVAEIGQERKGPLFRTIDKHRRLTTRAMDPNDALRMIDEWPFKQGCRRRCAAARSGRLASRRISKTAAP